MRPCTEKEETIYNVLKKKFENDRTIGTFFIREVEILKFGLQSVILTPYGEPLGDLDEE